MPKVGPQYITVNMSY